MMKNFYYQKMQEYDIAADGVSQANAATVILAPIVEKASLKNNTSSTNPAASLEQEAEYVVSNSSPNAASAAQTSANFDAITSANPIATGGETESISNDPNPDYDFEAPPQEDKTPSFLESVGEVACDIAADAAGADVDMKESEQEPEQSDDELPDPTEEADLDSDPFSGMANIGATAVSVLSGADDPDAPGNNPNLPAPSAGAPGLDADRSYENTTKHTQQNGDTLTETTTITNTKTLTSSKR